MSDAGFIVLHRKAMQSWLWQISDGDFKLAMTCLLMANWQSGKWFDGAKMVHVERGSFITSAEKLATRCGPGFTRKKVRGGLARLQAAEFLKLGTQQGQKWTLVTIENYSKYQDKPEAVGQVMGQVRAKSGPSEGQVRATIEQGNKGTREQGNQDQTLSVADGSDPLPVSGDESRGETKPTPPTSSAKTSKPKPPPTETATRAAKYLQGRILVAAPNCAAARMTPKQLEAWARTLDKLEGLSPEHTWRAIKETVDWLHDSENTFVVQSPAALSAKWDSIQANRRKSPISRNGVSKPEDPYERAARIREKQAAQ